LPDGELGDVGRRHPLKKREAARARDGNPPHVTDVEEAGVSSDGLVFADDAGVLDGHVPSSEIDEFSAVGTMLFDERSLFHILVEWPSEREATLRVVRLRR
jgi:hypothetical protein